MDKKNKKRLLFIEDLYDFYLNKYKRSTHFSAEKSGHQIFVQVPARFDIVENDYEDNSLLFCKVKLMHSGENRNHSCVTDEALIKASKGLSYKPILANFMEYTDEKTGETLKDFTSHDIEITENGINYIEKQIGCFTSDDPFFEIEEETGHNFLYGYCAIPREYTDATSIIERKGGTKISVELAINEMAYNAKSKVLEFTDVVIMGATCLGKDPDTLEDVGEGTLNARLDIDDFSSKNNSLFSEYDFALIELQERLEKLEACFNKKQNIPVNTISKEGGIDNKMTKFEELLTKYNKTVEDITFDYAKMSDEELEVKFTEMFDDDAGKGKFDNPSSNGESSVSTNSIGENFSKDELFNKLFELSFDDIRYALNALCSIYRNDSEWCYVSQVYEDYFIMQDWDSDKFYKQTYEKDGDNVSLSGERIEMFSMLLTESEKTVVDEMRSNYTALKEFKENAEKNELHSKREKILEGEKFASISEKDTEGNFVNKDFENLYTNMDNYSFEDLEKEAKVILADYALSVQTFSAKPTAPKSSVLYTSNSNSEKESKEKDPYGGIFKKYKQK